ncbi:MAG: hypothetical protein KDC87_20635 [Planctomycetes bacterium]|nr:hypothetical protein [Planctomycetota bacterium]
MLLFGSVLPAQAAQDKKRYEVKTDKDGRVSISIAENQGLPMTEFISLAHEITGKRFTYDKDQVSQATPIFFIGTMTLQKKEDFFGFFQTLLIIKNFACNVHGEGTSELIEIVNLRAGTGRPSANSGALHVPPEELEKWKHHSGVVVMTSMNLEHLDATKITQQLRPLLATSGAQSTLNQVAISPKTLLMQGFAPQVYQAYKLLKLVDIPEEKVDNVIEPVRLEHAAAEELEPLLNDLLGERARARPTQGNQQQPIGASQAMKILAQATTNVLILAGTREQVIEAKDIIAQLDRPMEDTEDGSRVIRLENVVAKELEQTIKTFLDLEKTAEDQARAGNAANARRPRRPVVVAHEETNKLLVSAPATKFAQLRRMIEALDERQRQVLVECAVVELTTSDLKRFGIELGLLDIKANGKFTRPFGFSHFGQSVFNDTDDDGLPDTRLPDFDNPLQGFTGGIISGGDFAIPVLINALSDDKRANVLSLPSVIVNNNENATVSSLEDRPTQQVSQGTATTQSGFSGFQNAGINLTISPSISSNNYLRLNIDLLVSRFITPFDPAAATPGVKATRQVKTQVTLPSGHTMVIGGVIEDQESTTETGVPFLKDIPLLGWLFKVHVVDNRKTNLYFFLTPHILDEEDFSDLDALSTRKKLEAEHYIGTRRLELIDPKWDARRAKASKLDDPGATIEDIDRGLGMEFPARTPAGPRDEKPTGKIGSPKKTTTTTPPRK